MKPKYLQDFWALMAVFLMLAGCGKEEQVPTAVITFLPEGDVAAMTAGEVFSRKVIVAPREKLKTLRIEKSVSGVKQPFLALTAFADTGAVYTLTDTVAQVTGTDSTVVYYFWATTTDDKTTVRTFTINVTEVLLHSNVKIGAALDSVTGHYYSARNNQVITPADSAKEHAAEVDFVYYYQTASATEADTLYKDFATIAAPSSPYAMQVYNSQTNGLGKWPARNATKFKRATAADFDLPGVYSLINAWKASEAKEELRMNKLTADVNSVFFFVTAADKIGVAKVRDVITAPSADAGHILMDVRVQK